ncbi:choice-of-anchor I domain-containing protein [Bacillus sp. 3255]|uniref:choice-of-anchor I domain-containing protein n=1 Tax=Bacillus sp. 3255 TaxID=2817904 RepID=UPI0037BEFF39
MYTLINKNNIAAAITGCVLAASLSIGTVSANTDDIQLRKAIENMQGTVTWNEQDRSVTLNVSGIQATIAIDQDNATLQGKAVKLSQKPYISKDIAYISHEFFKLIRDKVVAEQNQSGLELLGSYSMPSQKAEIAASTPDGKRLIVTEANLGSIRVLNIEDVTKVSDVQQISFKSVSDKAEVTSVAVTPDGKFALAAVRTGDHVSNPSKGFVAVVDLSTLETVKTYEVGIGPDSIAISKDGQYAVIAIEDEEIDPTTEEIDMPTTKRPGSIAILTLPAGDATKGELTDVAIDLSQTGGGAVYLHDPQPEYVAISPDSATAAVTLQENNAIAIVDLKTKKITKTFGLGTTKHLADLKKDDKVSFQDELTARPEPDGIVFTADGKYLVTANEGDLGKDEFKDGVKSGGRNIMVWDLDGKPVYDSKELVDLKAAQAGLYPDDRSANRGSEVENVTIGEINGKQLLAVAAERDNAILFFDVTDPIKPIYQGLIPSAGVSPEGIHKVNGRDLFVSADEVSGTISFYGVK